MICIRLIPRSFHLREGMDPLTGLLSTHQSSLLKTVKIDQGHGLIPALAMSINVNALLLLLAFPPQQLILMVNCYG